MSAESHVVQDAWMLADRALELAERTCVRLAEGRHRSGAESAMNRALDVALVLFNRAEDLERTARHPGQEGNRL
ncbi:hypothetical protein [Streptomyces mirabilis]